MENEDEDEDEDEEDTKMYLMEFMSVICTHLLQNTSSYVLPNLNIGGANWEVIGNMVLSIGFYARSRRVRRECD